MRATGVLLLVGLVFGLWAGGGCDDPADLCAPEVVSGTISGRVRTGGLPWDAYVRAKYLDDDHETSSEFLAAPDASGFYSLTVPPGRYTLRLTAQQGRYDYSHLGPSYGQFPPDTLVIEGTEALGNIDFDLGGVTLDLELPTHLHGQDGKMVLYRFEEGEWVDDYSLVREGYGEIVTGRFQLTVAGVLPGDYKVEISLGCPFSHCWDGSDGEIFWMPGTHDQEQSPLYHVGPDSVVTLTESILGEQARLEGRVSGAWLEMGVSNEPVLSIVSEDSLLALRNMRVERDGTFSAGFLVTGNVKLMVSQGGIDQWIGGPGFAEATIFALQPGETISGIELAQCGFHLEMLDSGLPLEGGLIRVYDETGGSLAGGSPVGFHSGRHAAVVNLWPGEYLVQITPDPWLMGSTEWIPQWFDRVETPEMAQRVVLTTAGEVARLDVELELGGQISGRVIRENVPLPAFQIFIFPAGSDTYWAQIYNWQEDFHLRGLPDGDYVFGVNPIFGDPEPGLTVWYPGTYNRQEAQVVEIRDASVMTGADIIFPE